MIEVFGSTLAYSIWLWIGTGLFLLRVDTVRLQQQNYRKEKKIARFAGWFNLAAGIGLLFAILLT
jgi:hypothetical protein